MKAKQQKNRKAQTWSIDIILGVVLFLLLLVIIYSLISSSAGSEYRLRKDADVIYSKLDAQRNSGSDLPKIMDGNSLSQTELTLLAAMPYDEVKRRMGISGDFCIVLVDSYGAIKNVSPTKRSIGSGTDLVIGTDSEGNDIYCGQ